MWETVFRENKKTYTEPKLVLFRDTTESRCAYASSAMGPGTVNVFDFNFLRQQIGTICPATTTSPCTYP